MNTLFFADFKAQNCCPVQNFTRITKWTVMNFVEKGEVNYMMWWWSLCKELRCFWPPEKKKLPSCKYPRIAVFAALEPVTSGLKETSQAQFSVKLLHTALQFCELLDKHAWFEQTCLIWGLISVYTLISSQLNRCKRPTDRTENCSWFMLERPFCVCCSVLIKSVNIFDSCTFYM